MSHFMTHLILINTTESTHLFSLSCLFYYKVFFSSFISLLPSIFFLKFKQFSLNFQPFFHQYVKLHSLVRF